MPTPMKAFSLVAERFGGVDPGNERQVEQFFAEDAPALPEKEQAEILEALLEFEGEDLEPLGLSSFSTGPSEILLQDSPPLAVPDTELGVVRSYQIGEMAGTMASAFSSLLYTAGLDVKVSLTVDARSVKLLLAGPDAGRLEKEDQPLLATMERLAEILGERNEAVDQVTVGLSTLAERV